MRTFLLSLFLLLCSPVLALPEDCRQLVLVTTDGWDAKDATLTCYGRAQAWTPAFGPMAGVVGRNGLAWGRGLAASHPSGGPIKQEGDGRAPAGLFTLPEAFGYLESRPLTRMPFRVTNPEMVGVDDPKSRFYNRLIDRRKVKPDWTSAEQMYIDDYRLGLRVGHNLERIPGGGSCIFIHRWGEHREGTAGCTALSREDLEKLCTWLDPELHPLLVQLPRELYFTVKTDWGLP